MTDRKEMQRTHSAPVRMPKKTRVTLYLDPAVIALFRTQAAQHGTKYQTLINEALRHTINPDSAPLTIESLRRVLREELCRHCAQRSVPSDGPHAPD